MRIKCPSEAESHLPRDKHFHVTAAAGRIALPAELEQRGLQLQTSFHAAISRQAGAEAPASSNCRFIY